ncbi:MAG: PQQ-binding-like beta-propeller repeat protein [Alphaproteobacteria bacterium]|nr:PQQ-binding-like beta-propeller repeat protein [Alphaproteobacteria bacterium]
MSKKLLLIAAFIGALNLSGCGMFGGDDDEAPLKGDRISLFDLEQSISGKETPAAAAEGPDTAMVIPSPWKNEFWPQAGGYANHAMAHVALGTGELKKIWSSDIGSGASKDLPLSAQPVIADGRVFTMDTEARVKAFSASTGKTLWSNDAKPESEDDAVIGGGVAFSGGRLFVTAGFNEVVALHPDDGHVLWRTKLPGTARSAPSAMPDRVYVVTVDNQTIALNAADGKEIWTHQGLAETTGLLGAASPAANRDIVLPAYSSGEIYALQAETGTTLWSDTVAPMARAGTGAMLSDIRGLPVIDHGLVVAISYGGRIAAIDEHTGERRWDAKIAGAQAPFVSGNRVFVVSADSIVYSLDMSDGKTLWKTELPRYEDPESLEGQLVWYGPVLAGGRLLAFSSNGLARELDPQTGKITREWSTGQNIIAPPSIASETLYLLSESGTLTAWK